MVKLIVLVASLFIWLVELMGWLFIPPTLLVLISFVILAYFLFGVLVNSEHELAVLAGFFIALSSSAGSWIYKALEQTESILNPMITGRIVLILLMVLSILGTFVYRQTLISIKRRRGNIEKEKLVFEEKNLKDVWKRIKEKYFRNKETENEKAKDIYFTLGEKVEQKE